ncbi:MAG: hypothetical protein ACHQRM_02205 [Bacteroidia bacterium]
MNRFASSCFLILFFYSLAGTAQEKKDNEADKAPAPVKTKMLIIPPERKMYMSDIDRSINKETKMTVPQIRETLRQGLDNQLMSRFKITYKPVSLLKDTSKTGKDLRFIYKSIGYKYTLCSGKEKPDDQKSVSNGQITTPTHGDEERYMRTVINQPGLLEAMHKKYGAELFVFISELDLKGAVSTDLVPQREAWVHFTTYDVLGKQVGGGLAKVKFEPGQNDPKKISNQVLSVAAKIIYNRSIPPAQTVENKTQPKPH